MKSPGQLETFPGEGISPTAHRVLAHQGGWDEILLVVGPLALIGLLLWVANRRVAAQLEANPETGSDTSAPGSTERDQGKAQ